MNHARRSLPALVLALALVAAATGGVCASAPLPRIESPSAPAPRALVAPRDRVLAEASALVGTTEATGRNDGPMIEAILKSAGASKGDPYCAAFNYWCYLRAGLAARVPRSAWSPDWVRAATWTRAKGGRTPMPGDSFGIYFASKGRVAHTGLVEEWGDRSVRTLEGNTAPEAVAGSAADRDGGGIYRKRRLVSQIYAVRNWLD